MLFCTLHPETYLSMSSPQAPLMLKVQRLCKFYEVSGFIYGQRPINLDEPTCHRTIQEQEPKESKTKHGVNAHTSNSFAVTILRSNCSSDPEEKQKQAKLACKNTLIYDSCPGISFGFTSSGSVPHHKYVHSLQRYNGHILLFADSWNRWPAGIAAMSLLHAQS